MTSVCQDLERLEGVLPGCSVQDIDGHGHGRCVTNECAKKGHPAGANDHSVDFATQSTEKPAKSDGHGGHGVHPQRV